MSRCAQHDKCGNASMIIIQGPPEIPGGNGAVRAPLISVLHQLFRRGKVPFAKSFGEAFPYSVIIDWPDIGPAKIEKQKHLDSPATDTAHLRKTRDDLVIAHSEKRASGWHGAVNRLGCEIFYCRGFGARKASGAKFLIRCGENFCGVEPFCFWIKRADPTPDCCGGFPVELLVCNRFSQRIERADRDSQRDVVPPRPSD